MAKDANSRVAEGIQLPDRLEIVNVGLSTFAESAESQGADVVDVEWRIPAGGDAGLIRTLESLYGRHGRTVDEANAKVVERLDEAAPQVVAVSTVAEFTDLDERVILHCGPPVEWGEACNPLQRSVRAAVVAEGWADDPSGAQSLLERGEVRLEPANHHGGAVPMASAVGPSAPALVAEMPDGRGRAFSSVNQGPGVRAWMGADAAEAVENLVWLRDVAGPVLAAVVEAHGPVDVLAVAAQALQMGDDVHMRSQAATNLLLRNLLPALVELGDSRSVEVARFLSSDHLFFLNWAMAAAKITADAAAGVAGSSIVVSMARNGTSFGIRLSGTGDRWFVADSPAVGDALYHEDYGEDDAARDIGDSAVLELIGLGGAAAAASPAVAGFLGGTLAEAIESTERFEQICITRSRRFKAPVLGFRGTPLGVDARRVVETEHPPTINTGILDAEQGRGQIGAGIARAPLACFQEAVRALDDELSTRT